MTHPLTTAMEDYLKSIYELGGEAVGTQDLAAALEVSPASVTGMLKKLALLKLVDYEKYYGASLTAAGRKIALETIRHHRLIETYLAEALGYAWHEVHDEAEKLEHVISEIFEERIAELLGHPTHDPHGDPIPRRDGTVPESLGKPLAEHGLGDTLELTRVTLQDGEVLRYLDGKGLKPGSIVTVLAFEPAGRLMTLKQEGGEVTIAQELAEKIYGQALDKIEAKA